MFAKSVMAALLSAPLCAGAALAQSAGPPSALDAPAFPQSGARALHLVTLSNEYTDALNTLYAHGYHGVTHLRMQNGMIAASADGPQGNPQTVLVDPRTGQISGG